MACAAPLPSGCGAVRWLASQLGRTRPSRRRSGRPSSVACSSSSSTSRPAPSDDHEPVPVLVERPARLLGGVVPRAHGLQLAETGQPQRDDGRLGAAGDHHVGGAVADEPVGVPDRVVRGGARRDDAEARALGLEADRDVPRRLVGDHHGDRERVDGHGALLDDLAEGRLEGLDAADAVAEDHADALGVHAARGEAGVGHGLDGGDHRVLREPVHPARVFRPEDLLGDEAFQLARQLRGVLRDVEPGEPADPVLPRLHRVPEVLHAVAQGIHGPHACHHNPTRHCSSLAGLFRSTCSRRRAARRPTRRPPCRRRGR